MYRLMQRVTRIQLCLTALPMAVFAAGVLAVSLLSAQVDEADWAMYNDPKVPVPEFGVTFPAGLAELWTETLKRPERDLKRRAAASMIQGQERGVGDLEIAIPQLIKQLKRTDLDRLTRLTVTQALVSLDARQAADLLHSQLTPGDLDMAEMIEPALARWAYPAAMEMWLKRIDEEIVFRRSHVLAIESLLTAGVLKALPRFLRLAADPRCPGSVRLAAADGLGQLQDEGLLKQARLLAQNKDPEAFIDRLVAARMIVSHRGAETEALMAELALDTMPSVQAVALRCLNTIDPHLIMPLEETVLDSTDSTVRRLVADALATVAKDPASDRIPRLSLLLDDVNPSLRKDVTDTLVALAGIDALHDTVIAEARSMLGQDSWRGQVQAIHVLVALDDKTIVDRCLELLESPRAETHTAAAWGLCQLSVPETAERILTVLDDKTKRWLGQQSLPPATNEQLCHLAQAMGRLEYAPADKVLREYVPKETSLPLSTRAAAIWALGHLHANDPDPALARQLGQRLADIYSLVPEDSLVRRMAAVSLGRMKSPEGVSSLQSSLNREGLTSPVGAACGWALANIAGEEPPSAPSMFFNDGVWFMVPSKSGAVERKKEKQPASDQ